MNKAIKANKKGIGSAIKWSSSKYNELKKSDVIMDILSRYKEGKDCRAEYSTGSYSPRGHLGGWSYVFEIKSGRATLTEQMGNKVTVYDVNSSGVPERPYCYPCKHLAYDISANYGDCYLMFCNKYRVHVGWTGEQCDECIKERGEKC